MKKDLKEIEMSFKGRLIGKKMMKKKVCQVLMLMEEDIINFITSRCWFVSSMEDAYGFTLTGKDLENYHLIFLSDDLLEEPEYQIYYTIAHEIGHVMLGHKNSILKMQTKEEIKKQEKQADRFAKSYI